MIRLHPHGADSLRLLLILITSLLLGMTPIKRAQADPPPATTFSQALALAQARGQVSSAETSTWQLRSIYAPATLPAFLRPTAPEISASMLLRHLQQHKPDAVHISNPAARRPGLPSEQVYDSVHFRIHYTLVGTNAINPGDRDHDQIPDYVEFLGDTAETTWNVLNRQLQWPLPQADALLGGDNRTDIYLLNLERVYLGYTDSDPGRCGDNPHTPTTEIAACSAFIVLTNDMSGLSTPPIDLARVTFAHEYMHVLQFGLDSTEPSDWLWEAWAVWAEDKVFDNINLYLNLLPPLFLNPDAPLDEHPYAMALLPMWIDEHIDTRLVRDIWLLAPTHDGMEAVAAALQHQRLPLRSTLMDISAALTTHATCPQFTPFCWRDGRRFPRIRLEGTLETGNWNSQNQGNGRLAAYGQDIIQLSPVGAVRVRLLSRQLDYLALQIVTITTNSRPQMTRWSASAGDGALYIDLPAPQAETQTLAIVSAPAGVNVAEYELQMQAATTPVPQDSYRLYLPLLTRLSRP